jgi:hypothetical protein
MNPARHLSMATLLVALGLGSCGKANTEPRPAAPVDAGPDHGAGGCNAPTRVLALALSPAPSLSRRTGKGAASRAGCVVSYKARGS